jgi:hypothetical protein
MVVTSVGDVRAGVTGRVAEPLPEFVGELAEVRAKAGELLDDLGGWQVALPSAGACRSLAGVFAPRV